MYDINERIGEELAQAYEDGYEQGRKTAMRWISVKDRLPELPTNGNYVSRMFLTCRNGDKRATVMLYERTVVRGKTVERWKYYWDRIADFEPDFWMPLPEPPEGE